MARPSGYTTPPRRKSSTQHYQTFSTPPPKSRGQPPSESPDSDRHGSSRHSRNHSNASNHVESPLPKKQMLVLAIIALSEQTALNSISPYLPDMASTFPEVDPSQVGVYVGTIASAFALAQFATNFFWGWLSDKIGRKPVILVGTALTAACFVAFGFCRTLWQAILVQALMGLVNGNQGVVSTCLGEITDRSNQSKAFTYLPVLYGLGGITGPIVGGLLVFQENPFRKGKPNPYPYLGPNLFAALVLLVDLVLTVLFLEESLEGANHLPLLKKRVMHLFTRLWQFSGGSTRPTYVRRGSRYFRYPVEDEIVESEIEDENDNDDDDSESDTESTSEDTPLFPEGAADHLTRDHIFKRDTILLLITYLIFALANISFNSLYPIFAQAPPPTGRHLTPKEIGLSLAFAGAVTILFQVGIFGKLRDKMGNKVTYRAGLFGFMLSFIMMPWVGYKNETDYGPGAISHGKVSLGIELAFVLLVKTVAAVGGLTSALLLITNSAPNHSVLGTLNGLAQTLSAAGRAIGPFISGGLFSLATRVEPKGEALAFGVFGGVAFLGFLLSFGIRGGNLEAEGFEDGDGEEDEEEGGVTEADKSDEDEDGR